MLRGVFVTGTDTNVGKTVASAALLCRYRSAGWGIRYWKPIQTGIEQDDDTKMVRTLAEASEAEVRSEGIRLPRPVSPHLAARLAGRPIDLNAVIDWARSYDGGERWIVEGAGGVLVPINESELMIDLIAMLQLPVVVVTRTTLGTINHTLLTLEALRSRKLCVAGVLMAGESNAENRAAIEKYGDVAILGEMPLLKPLNAAKLRQWARTNFDSEGRLAEFFQ